MGMSKKDLVKRRGMSKKKLEELEHKAKLDPLHKDKALWEELEQVRKRIAES